MDLVFTDELLAAMAFIDESFAAVIFIDELFVAVAFDELTAGEFPAGRRCELPASPGSGVPGAGDCIRFRSPI